MKKSCLLYLAAFALFVAGYTTLFVLLWPPVSGATPDRLPLEARVMPSLLAGGIAALFSILAVGCVDGVLMRLRDRRRLGRALSGQLPQDGPYVAAGTLVADGPPHEAPLSGTSCAVYHYEVHSSGSKGSDSTVCWGYALTPSHVHTPSGAAVRLLAYTDLDFKAAILSGPEMLEHARRHFESARWVTIGLGSLGNAFDALKEVLADDDGSIRTDFGPAPTQLENPRLSFHEKLVRDREPVCAFGIYSVARGGLVPVPGSRDVWPIRIVKGTGEQVRGKLLRSAVGQAILAVVFAAAAGGIVAGFLRIALEIN